jgi:hypothetical protein
MNEDIIKAIREMFKTPGSRSILMLLMLEETRYEKMKEKNHNISYTEIIKMLREEFNDITESIEMKERNEIIDEFMKDIEL